jgi:hypothetical protein
MVIHLCDYASQPSIQISCDQTWTTPKWGPSGGKTSTEGVYETDDDRLYTFERSKATCPLCIAEPVDGVEPSAA